MKLIWKKFLETIEEEVMSPMLDEEGFAPIVLEKKLLTPLGYLPEDFNLWLGHTDFILTSEHVDKIKQVSGVEILDVYTPYRFKLAVGMAFDDKKVKREIQSVLGVGKQPVEVEQSINEVKKGIELPYWAIYVAPNGKTELFQSENLDDAYKELEIYEATRKVAGGHVEHWRTVKT